MTSLCLAAAVLASLIAIGVAYLVMAYSEGDYRFRWQTILGALSASLLLTLLVSHVATGLSLSDAVKYQEFWNGYEKEATVKVTKCERDGDCDHTYECDEYWETETYTETDSDGNTVTKTRQVEKHHDCPQVTEEFTYRVKTTLDDFTILSHGFSDNPKEWRRGERISNSIFRGVPPLWQEVKDRIDRGDPGPVTVKKEYENYVLASQSSLLKKYSSDIDTYKSKNLLPSPTSEIHDFYRANKVSFVGYQPADQNAWQNELARLNAAAGTQLQGDVHLVLVSADLIENPDSYSGALSAYWQSKTFGREALSKNGIGVVVCIKDEKVAWSRAFTGMPRGNEGLMQDILSRLKDQPVTSESIIGHPVAAFGDGEGFDKGVKIVHGSGALEQALWGPNKFVRVSMKGGGEKGPGYAYLKSELQPSSSEKITAASILFVLCLLIWGAAAGINSSLSTRRKTNATW